MATERRTWLTYESLDSLASRVRTDNPKQHALLALDTSLERFGFVTPILLNEPDGLINEGHGRIEALLAWRTRSTPPPSGIQVDRNDNWLVPTIHVTGLSALDARAYVVAANRLTELGGWDEQGLANVLSELANSASGLDGVGFSDLDLDGLIERLAVRFDGPGADPDEVPEEPADSELYVQRGQLWRLGAHRLLCGDATSGPDVAKLLEGRPADLAVTDPPYNVSLGRNGGASSTRKRRRPILNDALPEPEWEEFVRGWAGHLLSRVEGGIYVFMSTREWPVVTSALADAGGHWSTTLIWAKDRFVLGRADYQRQYEVIWYGWRQGVHRYWCGGRDQGDVWLFPRPSASELHPTMKPVALIERAIANSSQAGARVLDLFLGSGTTLIASERLGRRCLGMELEPRYVQTAIERWERYTGRRALLEERGA